ncbi:MAG: GNAT family N-acetyltransferase [Chitinophagaceae bacterium]|nr:MAG: GNAT family N-acetyltransferase [Chitinophagaceae bacterium]
MIKAKADDKAWVVNLLSQAFDENQSVNYIVLQDKNRKKRVKALMEYSFDICSMFGEVWLSDDRQACALIFYPEKKKITFKSIYFDIKLILKTIGITRISRALQREANIKAKQPKICMSYLWFIGVNPSHQKHGIGSKLLQEIIEYAKQQDRPVFLETSTLKNLPWYERFGFKIYDKLELGYTLYFLSNNPA